MLKAIEVVADTLSQKPEVGVFSSMVGVALSPIGIISLISAVLGLAITVITLIIKVMDIREKIRRKKNIEANGEYMVIEGTRYKVEKVEQEEEE